MPQLLSCEATVPGGCEDRDSSSGGSGQDSKERRRIKVLVWIGHQTTAVGAEDVNSPVKLEGEVLENKDKVLRLDRAPRG